MISGQTEGWKVERGGAFTTEKGLDSGTNGNQKLHAFQLIRVLIIFVCCHHFRGCYVDFVALLLI